MTGSGRARAHRVRTSVTAVTLLWNDVTAVKRRRSGGHDCGLCDYLIRIKYWRRTSMARATSQMVSIGVVMPALTRSRRSARRAPRPLDSISPAGPLVQPRWRLGTYTALG